MTDNKLIDKLDNDNIPVFSVSEITKEITALLEVKYSYVKIKGEISGETGNKYPEIYFTLKDDENVMEQDIKCLPRNLFKKCSKTKMLLC